MFLLQLKAIKTFIIYVLKNCNPLIIQPFIDFTPLLMTNAMFCCIKKSQYTCITSNFQAWKSPQCPLTDPCPIRQPHPSMGHSMGTCLTLQAIRLTPPAIQLTHPWETCLTHQTVLPTLTSKMCRMQSVLYGQQADMFWYFNSVHVHVCTFYTF